MCRLKCASTHKNEHGSGNMRRTAAREIERERERESKRVTLENHFTKVVGVIGDICLCGKINMIHFCVCVYVFSKDDCYDDMLPLPPTPTTTVHCNLNPFENILAFEMKAYLYIDMIEWFSESQI